MKITNKLNPILRDIEHYFGFLYGMDFHIQETNVRFMSTRNWEVVFESPACLIKVLSDQYTVFVAFSPINIQIDNRLGLQSMIYYLSKGQRFIGRYKGDYRDRKGQLERLANLLREYIDQITPYFESQRFQEYHDELLRAQKEYYNKYVKKYVPEISSA